MDSPWRWISVLGFAILVVAGLAVLAVPPPGGDVYIVPPGQAEIYTLPAFPQAGLEGEASVSPEPVVSGEASKPSAPPDQENLDPNLLLLPPAPEPVEEGEASSAVVRAVIPGRVVDPSGIPIAGMKVTLRFPGMEKMLPSSETDASGSFVLFADMAAWHTVSTDSMFLLATGQGMAGMAEIFLCDDEQEAAMMRASFPELTVRVISARPQDSQFNPVITAQPEGGLRGSVTDSGGIPVAGLDVEATPDRLWTDTTRTTTDEKGEYSFQGLVSGIPYQVSCSDASAQKGPGPPYVSKLPVAAMVPVGTTGDVLPLICDAATRSLSGCVLDCWGVPVAGATVASVPMASWDTWKKEKPNCQTDAQGRFRLVNLLPGGYLVCAIQDGEMPCIGLTQAVVPGPDYVVRLQACGEDETQHSVTEDGEPQKDDEDECGGHGASDGEPFGWLSAQLHDTGGDLPKTWYEVCPLGPNGGQPAQQRLLDPGEDEKEHRLAPGRYRIYAAPTMDVQCLGTRIASVETTVCADRATSARMTIPHGPVTVVGTVRVQGMCPGHGIIIAMTPGGTLLACSGIDNGGRFVLPGMPPGPVLLCVKTDRNNAPVLGGVNAFRTILLPRSGICRRDISLEYGAFTLGRMLGLPKDHGMVPLVLPDGWTGQDIRGLDDGIRLDHLRFKPETARELGMFLISGGNTWLAAGDYAVAVGISPPGTPSVIDRCGAWAQQRLTLPPITSQKPFHGLTFNVAPLFNASVTEDNPPDSTADENCVTTDTPANEESAGDPSSYTIPEEDSFSGETPENAPMSRLESAYPAYPTPLIEAEDSIRLCKGMATFPHPDGPHRTVVQA